MIGITIEDISVGDTRADRAARRTTATSPSFVDAVGDYNPVHADRDYAATTMFKEPIAPGIWTAGLISAVIGTRLPGPGRHLSLPGAQVPQARVLRRRHHGARGGARGHCASATGCACKTVCSNQRGEEVLTGEALVMPSKTARGVRPAPRRATGLVSLWTLGPWAWAAQGTAVLGMMGLSALSAMAGAGGAERR